MSVLLWLGLNLQEIEHYRTYKSRLGLIRIHKINFKLVQVRISHYKKLVLRILATLKKLKMKVQPRSFHHKIPRTHTNSIFLYTTITTITRITIIIFMIIRKIVEQIMIVLASCAFKISPKLALKDNKVVNFWLWKWMSYKLIALQIS